MGIPLLDDIVGFLAVKFDTPFSKYFLNLDQFNLLITMMLSFPIGYINRYLKNNYIRLIYGLLTGILLQYQMFGSGIIHVVVATLNTYFFIHFLGRKFSSFYIIIFNIAHLSALHIRNMINDYGEWTLGIETLYMMSICKFSTVAFNYEDGGKDEKEIRSSYHREK
jgi:hypothetical protein